MELHRTEQGFALYKEKDCIGECCLSPAPKGAQLAALCILPRWRRKGYGSYLLKEVLRSFGGYDREAATVDRKSTRLNSSHGKLSRMPSSA